MVLGPSWVAAVKDGWWFKAASCKWQEISASSLPAVSHPFRVVDHFIHRFPFEHLAQDLLGRSIGFPEQRRIARILHVQ